MDKSKQHWERIQAKKKRDKEREVQMYESLEKSMNTLISAFSFGGTRIYPEEYTVTYYSEEEEMNGTCQEMPSRKQRKTNNRVLR